VFLGEGTSSRRSAAVLVLATLAVAVAASLCVAQVPADSGRPEFTGGRYSPRTRAILDTLRPDPSVFERTYPETWDWREMGGVTALRDQGTCEFCWAFAAYAEIESGILINEGVSLNLAEQQPADCNAEGHDCDSGGYPGSAFDLARSPGAVAEECMPYIDDNGACRQRFCEKIAYVDGYTYTAGNVDAYKAAIMEAPIAACDGIHCILIVGWDDSIQSWICKDSLYGGFWSYYAYGSWMTTGAVRSINPHTPKERLVPDEFPTIQAALDASQRGDVIKVAGGVYAEAVVVPPMRTLEGGYDPTFTTREPETYPTVIDAGGAYVGVTCGEQLPGSEHLTVDGFEITNATSAGVWVLTGDAVVLRDLEIHGCGSGVVVDSSYPIDGSVRIESCVIRDNAFDGVQAPFLSPHEAVVSWSAVYGNGGSGISAIYSPIAVVNCMVYGNGLDGVTVGNQSEATVLSIRCLLERRRMRRHLHRRVGQRSGRLLGVRGRELVSQRGSGLLRLRGPRLPPTRLVGLRGGGRLRPGHGRLRNRLPARSHRARSASDGCVAPCVVVSAPGRRRGRSLRCLQGHAVVGTRGCRDGGGARHGLRRRWHSGVRVQRLLRDGRGHERA